MIDEVERFPISGRAGITRAAAGDMGPSSAAWVPARSIVFAALKEWASEEELPEDPSLPTELLVLPQTHSTVVHAVDSGTAGRDRPIGDGLITDDPGVVLGVTVADCLPIFLCDAQRGVRGLVHSGRRGTGIVTVALDAMSESYGTDPHEVDAYIGPGICGRCYEVGEDVYREFSGRFEFAVEREGSYYLDLAAVNEDLLRHEGVRTVIRSSRCTLEDCSYSSYRREGAGFSRMLAFYAWGPTFVSDLR